MGTGTGPSVHNIRTAASTARPMPPKNCAMSLSTSSALLVGGNDNRGERHNQIDRLFGEDGESRPAVDVIIGRVRNCEAVCCSEAR